MVAADKVGKSAGMLARMRDALIVGSLLKGSGGSDDAAVGSNNVDVGQQGGNSGLRRSFRALDAPQHFEAIFASSLPLTTTMSGSSSPVIVNTNRPCQLENGGALD